MITSVISQEQFFREIFHFDKESHVCVIHRNKMLAKWASSLDELMRIIRTWDDAEHFIPATFYRGYKDRSNLNLRISQCMWFDFEKRKKNGSPYTPEEIADIFIEETGFIPSYIKPSRTKDNYHVGIAHTRVNGHKNSLRTYKNIQTVIARKVGCDVNAAGMGHPYYISQKIFLVWHRKTYDFEDIKNWYLNEIKPKWVEKAQNASKTESISEARVLHHPAIKALINGDIEDDASRNEAAFTLALLYYAMGKNKAYVKKVLLSDEWYDKVRKTKTKRFYKSEIKASIKSAFSGKYSGAKPEYIEKVTGIPCSYTVQKSTYKRKTKFNLKNENRQAIVNYLRARGGEVTMLVKDLIADLVTQGYKKSSIERHLSDLRKENVVSYETTRGKGAQPVMITLNDGVKKVTNPSQKNNRKPTPVRRILKPSLSENISSGRGAAGLVTGVRYDDVILGDTVLYSSDLFDDDPFLEVAATSEDLSSSRYEDIFDDDPFD